MYTVESSLGRPQGVLQPTDSEVVHAVDTTQDAPLSRHD